MHGIFSVTLPPAEEWQVTKDPLRVGEERKREEKSRGRPPDSW